MQELFCLDLNLAQLAGIWGNFLKRLSSVLKNTFLKEPSGGPRTPLQEGAKANAPLPHPPHQPTNASLLMSATALIAAGTPNCYMSITALTAAKYGNQ